MMRSWAVGERKDDFGSVYKLAGRAASLAEGGEWREAADVESTAS